MIRLFANTAPREQPSVIKTYPKYFPLSFSVYPKEYIVTKRAKNAIPSPARADRLSTINVGTSTGGQYRGFNMNMRTEAANDAKVTRNANALEANLNLSGINRHTNPANIGIPIT